MSYLLKGKYFASALHIIALVVSWGVAWQCFTQPTNSDFNATTNSVTTSSGPLSPLLSAGNPVKWWFVFKFNTDRFPGDVNTEPSKGIFGGEPTNYSLGFSLSYAYASSADGTLKMGTNCVGTSLEDPVGATFDQIYHGNCHYVIWNDQFKSNPIADDSSSSGHSKGVLAWDDSGAGFVMQVTTPYWPGSGSAKHARTGDGNTLGCLVGDDDVLVSQHFFALKLSAADVTNVLVGLANASVVTQPTNPQLANIGGPAGIQALAKSLGKASKSVEVKEEVLSSGVIFISKPVAEHVPPWQLVSAEIGGIPIRAATWWTDPDKIHSTAGGTNITCWDNSLGLPNPAAVEIATNGTWEGKSIGFLGTAHKNGNHAKIGVSKDAHKPWCIFGDMNQEGMLSGDANSCDNAQNGRGGTFYVLSDSKLFASMTALLTGGSDPVP